MPAANKLTSPISKVGSLKPAAPAAYSILRPISQHAFPGPRAVGQQTGGVHADGAGGFALSVAGAGEIAATQDQSAQPVPERVGEPSVFQHVIYIIKENRTYDQVLGDVKTGNGDADLCNFGGRRDAERTPDRPRFRAARQHLLLPAW